MKRKIIRIDEEKCNGCGKCVPGCAESALQVIDGKARLVADVYCDGLGACLGDCPQDALQIVERDAEKFDQLAVGNRLAEIGRSAATGQLPPGDPPHRPSDPFPGEGCPGSSIRSIDQGSGQAPRTSKIILEPPPPALSHWPVQLMLVPSHAHFLQGADILLCADCVPFAIPDFHARYLQGRALLVGCPKLDDAAIYLEKLTEIFKMARPRSLTVLRMEVPCCGGLAELARDARTQAGADTKLEVHIIGIQGGIASRQTIA